MLRRVLDYIKQNKLLCVVIFCATVLTLPLLFLFFYASPAADDFFHAYNMTTLLPSHANLLQYLGTVLGYAATIYKQTQGAFSVNFLIGLNPMTYNLTLIPFIYFANFVFFIFANYVFSDTISTRLLGADKKVSLLITAILLISTLQFIPLAESFYWYAGIIAYTLPYALALLFCSNLIVMFKARNMLPHLVLGVLLGFLLGGTNFSLGLFLCVVVTAVSIVSVLIKSKIRFYLLLVNVFLVSGFLINVIAPGNSGRTALRFELGFFKMSPQASVLMSFWQALISVAHILVVSTIVFFCILLIPKMIETIKKMEFNFQKPLLLSLFSFCAISSLFTSAYYAGIGDAIPPRYSNMTTMIITWVIYINVFYWLGWAVRKWNVEFDIKKMGIVFVGLALISLQSPLNFDNIKNVAFVSVTREITSGITGNYKREVDNMYKYFSTHKGTDVIYKLKTDTVTLKKININSDPGDWENVSLTKFFNLKSLRSRE